jgi:hypothetical protein
MAGLPGSKGIVCVGPPLLLRVPSRGVGLTMSPWAGFAGKHAVVSLRLLPCEVIGPLQFPPVLPTTMLFRSCAVFPFQMPPPAPLAELPLKVLLVTMSGAPAL